MNIKGRIEEVKQKSVMVPKKDEQGNTMTDSEGNMVMEPKMTYKYIVGGKTHSGWGNPEHNGGDYVDIEYKENPGTTKQGQPVVYRNITKVTKISPDQTTVSGEKPFQRASSLKPNEFRTPEQIMRGQCLECAVQFKDSYEQDQVSAVLAIAKQFYGWVKEEAS